MTEPASYGRGMLEVGEVVHGYEVEALLGDGGLASVYRVRHRTLGTLHALKVLVVGTPTDRMRLVSEGQVQAHLRHRNVVGVTDVLEINRLPALVMELVDGPSLDRWLAERREKPDLDTGLALFRGIVAGVGAAHAAGLVHRDLKPANVLVHSELVAEGPHAGRRTPPIAKVTDFGLVRVVGAPGGPTMSGSSVGTPAYMAPEQIRAPSEVDHRADLWSLGCLLYEIVCGRRAFPDTDLFALYQRIASGRFDDPAEHADPSVSPRVLEVVRELLVPDPDARIAGCDALWVRLWDDPPPAHPRISVQTSSSGWAHSLDHTLGPPSASAPAQRQPPDPPQPVARLLVGAAATSLAALMLALVALAVTWASVGPRGRVSHRPARPAVAAPLPPAPLAAPAEPVEPAPTPAAEPAPEPVPAPAPVTAPSPRRAATGSVTANGDARDVWLERDGARVALGVVPVGDYTVRAAWHDGAVRTAGAVHVTAGATITLRCASFVFACAEARERAP